MKKFIRALCCAGVLCVGGGPGVEAVGQLITPADTVGVVVIGDSLSDKGSYYEPCGLRDISLNPVTGYNRHDTTWVEYLATKREMPFGGRVQVHNRLHFRRTLNLSRNCADAPEINEPDPRLRGKSQAEAARDLVAAGDADIVIVMIGNNDIQLYGSLVRRMVRGELSAEDNARIDGVASNVITACNTITTGLDAAKRDRLKLIVSGVADVGRTPRLVNFYLQENVAAEVGRERSRAIVDRINGALRTWVLAQKNGVYADFPAMQDALADLDPLKIGGVTIDQVNAGGQPTQVFQDGVHPRAVGNGIIANLYLAAINRAIGKNLAMLTDREILIGAGIAGRFERVTLVGRFDFRSLITAAP